MGVRNLEFRILDQVGFFVVERVENLPTRPPQTNHANQNSDQMPPAKSDLASGSRRGPGHYRREQRERQSKDRVAEADHLQQLFDFVKHQWLRINFP